MPIKPAPVATKIDLFIMENLLKGEVYLETKRRCPVAVAGI
jgi:hypothetical protein